eukprot:CAMPEP_0174371202 /NCGR_PEP_ID=MMETSP0811_2-20130205/98948_1 /TAXON_ID=73025 ORGANISM="Eutreptiella gymnastica-like, Strain CCMP1594" /NCGR_SAMPLE_ID=MMETSP0811_2 /ASSEMBLY_ACC=CAM_ASM_000667 /LENGTH=189 /DNA_ID=CAMNT_0015517377 /DNA_START=309 /DNA_END=876 /DNA_ORIENTATION=-
MHQHQHYVDEEIHQCNTVVEAQLVTWRASAVWLVMIPVAKLTFTGTIGYSPASTAADQKFHPRPTVMLTELKGDVQRTRRSKHTQTLKLNTREYRQPCKCEAPSPVPASSVKRSNGYSALGVGVAISRPGRCMETLLAAALQSGAVCKEGNGPTVVWRALLNRHTHRCRGGSDGICLCKEIAQEALVAG